MSGVLSFDDFYEEEAAVVLSDSSSLKDLCACQKVSNVDLHTWSYSSVVPPCRCHHYQNISVPSKQTKPDKKKSTVSQDVQLLWNVLSILRSEEETDAIVLRGKHWVYVPRLQLNKRLDCSDEDIHHALDILCREDYVESLHLSLDEGKSSFFRTNRKAYKKFFWSYPAINHQAVNFWL